MTHTKQISNQSHTIIAINIPNLLPMQCKHLYMGFSEIDFQYRKFVVAFFIHLHLVGQTIVVYCRGSQLNWRRHIHKCTHADINRRIEREQRTLVCENAHFVINNNLVEFTFVIVKACTCRQCALLTAPNRMTQWKIYCTCNDWIMIKWGKKTAASMWI